MKPLVLIATVGMFVATQGVAEPVTFKEARKILPKANARVTLVTFEDRLSEKDIATLASANLKPDDVFKGIGASLSSYGAVAISPDEGVLVEWLSGVSQHHSIEAARAAAIAYCNSKKKKASADCVTLVEVSPRGAKDRAAFSLSEKANAALRSDYRKLDEPRAFAISPSTGDFGMERGDGTRAVAACASAANQASDCVVVVKD
jgi:hypothetical protein